MTTTSPPPLDETFTTHSTIIRSKDLWFEDGDIVLSVTEGGVDHQFLVHRSTLIIGSPVFREMFSLPQPPVEESPPVHLLDDSVQDLTALLRELYVTREAQIVTFDVALAILRLSHKYEIKGLQQRMKHTLRQDWPLKRSDYLARLPLFGPPEKRIRQTLKLIDEAEHCQANGLLPPAFYELSCIGATQCAEIAPKLSHKNLVRLWVGRTRVNERLKSFVNLDVNEPPFMWRKFDQFLDFQTIFEHRNGFSICSQGSGPSNLYQTCSSLLPTFRTIFLDRMFCGIPGCAILQNFSCDALDDVCNHCKLWFQSVLRDKMQELWDNIPKDFDLPAIDLELYSGPHVPTS